MIANMGLRRNDIVAVVRRPSTCFTAGVFSDDVCRTQEKVWRLLSGGSATAYAAAYACAGVATRLLGRWPDRGGSRQFVRR